MVSKKHGKEVILLSLSIQRRGNGGRERSDTLPKVASPLVDGEPALHVQQSGSYTHVLHPYTTAAKRIPNVRPTG